jgi:hypothetical protein
MRYLALIYSAEDAWDGLGPDERSSIYERYRALAEEARAAHVMLAGEELASTRDATTVRVRDAQTLVVDGPYAEAREVLGGFFLFECETMDDALEWASRIPAVEHGAVEVRPVVDHEAA